MRATTIRVFRYFLKDPEFSTYMWKYHCHLFFMRIFDFGKEKDKEKRQLVELIKQIMKRPSDFMNLPLVMVRGIIYLAENPEDQYQQVAIEILRDLSKFIFNSFSD